MTFDETKAAIEILKWPLTLLVLGIAALVLFRAPFASLLARAKRAGFGDKSVEFGEPTSVASEQKKRSGEGLAMVPPAQHHEGPPPPPNEALAPIEAEVLNTVNASHAPDDIKIAWLIRSFAQEKLQRIHEQNYRLIMGSQLTLLMQINTASTKRLSDARLIYEAAKIENPNVYEDFALDDWLTWPKNVGLIATIPDNPSNPIIRITPAGRDFMIYLVASGLTGPKAG